MKLPFPSIFSSTAWLCATSRVAQTALIDALTSALTLWRSMSIPQPLCLPFTETAATSKYFQSLFALVQKNNEPLRSLWQAVDGTLSGYFSDKASWPAFMPHLSLMYGTEDEVPPSTKADVILQLEKSGVIVKTESGLMLNGVKELPAKVSLFRSPLLAPRVLALTKTRPGFGCRTGSLGRTRRILADCASHASVALDEAREIGASVADPKAAPQPFKAHF